MTTNLGQSDQLLPLTGEMNAESPVMMQQRELYASARGTLLAQRWQVMAGSGRSHIAERAVVKHPGAVAIIAQPQPDQLLLVRQFRYALEDWSWEIPAGTCSPSEDWRLAAQRELLEEAGWQADSIALIQAILPAPGLTDEVLRLVRAEGLTQAEACPEADEVLAAHACTRSTVIAMVRQGLIADAKTLLALAALGWWPCP